MPGSLRAEVFPTMRYQQSIWARLHGEFDANDVGVFAFPEPSRRLRSADASTTDSWVTLIFGAGIRYEGDLVELVDAQGNAVPFQQAGNRWGNNTTRLLRILPEQNLDPGGFYKARMRADAELVNGERTTETWEVGFQVACASPDEPACLDLVAPRVASISGIVEPEPAARGCGCNGSTPAGWMAATLALLGLRRRPR